MAFDATYGKGLRIEYEEAFDPSQGRIGRIIVIIDNAAWWTAIPPPATPAKVSSALFDLACMLEQHASKIQKP